MIDSTILANPHLVPSPPSIDPLRSLRGIVYCIWNQKEDKRYIGITRNAFNVRYKAAKWWEETTNPLLRQDVERLGLDAFHVYLLETDIAPHELETLEYIYITCLNTLTPYGYNITYRTPNGENVLVQNEFTQAKMSKASTGRRHSTAFKDKMSTRMRGQNNPMYGRVIPLESRQRGALKVTGGLSGKALAVEQLDPASGVVVAEYACAAEAARALNVDRSTIAKVCRSRPNVRVKGFQWRYKA